VKLTKMGTGFDVALNLLGVGVCVIVAGMMLFVCTSLIMRYFLGTPVKGATEIVELLLLWLTFMGAAWVLRSGKHIRVDIVVGYLNPRTQAIINAIVSVLAAIAVLILVWDSAIGTRTAFQSGAYYPRGITIPDYFFLIIIPIGGFMLFIEFLRRANRDLRTWTSAIKPKATDVEKPINGSIRWNGI